MSSVVLKVDDVTLQSSVDNQYILKNICFSVNSKERLGIIGTVGSGKSSLLRLLNRLNSPTKGEIYFHGENISSLPVINLRRQIVLVPQEPKLLEMTVAETLAYPLILQSFSQENINQRLSFWCHQLKIPEAWLDRTELQLSLGQRQLVAIARALMMQPSIILLDEPTSALDFGVASNLIEILINLAQEHNITIIMVNHQLNVVEDFSQRVIWLNQGEMYQDIPSNQINWLDIRSQFTSIQQEINSEWEEEID